MGLGPTNDWLKYIFLLAWTGGNVAYWVLTFLLYENEAQYRYIRILTGCYRRSMKRLLDKNLTFHKTVAYTIVLLSIVHCIAHFFNFQYLYDAQVDSPEGSLKRYLSDLKDVGNDTWINPVRPPTVTAYGFGVIQQALRRIAGWSGVVITLSLLLMFTSATELIRHSYFETFWVTHHLFIIYFGFLLVHGIEGVVRSQSNAAFHDPFYCQDIPIENWKINDRCSTDPIFVKGAPNSYKWVSGPLFLYFIERFIRFIRRYQTVTITQVVNHPSRVVELRMTKKGFRMLPGQYIFIKCPSISHIQWHPFTLTSSPDEGFFSVHIRTVGDWTSSLALACGINSAESVAAEDLPRVSVDGPFGTASIDIFEYDVGMCIGAGIGVTPFASILKSIWYRLRIGDKDLKLRKVYFFWICPDTNAFEWFSELLSRFENDVSELGLSDFLNYNIYLTRGWGSKQARNIYLHEQDNKDPITGLRQKTHYGRPKWKDIFKQIASDNPGIDVGVFFCGPSGLSDVLKKTSHQHSGTAQQGCRFIYNKENF
ncbi:NADPH oxidase 2-like [Antedon mediterranea]|uniref:NADPH oxidase 2-like n=1 Tax=Antedon mediterranea TaxID=105859 RepID=UPI003AF62918